MIHARAISADKREDLQLAFARMRLPTDVQKRLYDSLSHLQILLTEVEAADRGFLERLPMGPQSSTPSVTWGAENRGTDVALLTGCREELQRLSANAVQAAPSLADALKQLLEGTSNAPVLQFGSERLVFGTRTYVMGVLNVTPDSFSDGGQFLDPERAVTHAMELVAAGADFLDVGGESTRPGAAEVDARVELERITPVLVALRARTDVPISVDTRKATVAEAAIELGASLINDVSGFHFDPALAEVVGRSRAGCCVMHAQGLPETMQKNPSYQDVMVEIQAFLERALLRAAEARIARERMLVDPGIGFGKTVSQNLLILRRLADLRTLGRPILVGTSRKSFLRGLTGGKSPSDRLLGTLGSLATIAANGSADIVRVHDVWEAKEALAVADAIRQAQDGGELFETRSSD